MTLPQAGTLVPLSTVSKKFNYTQDHLAYLCRKGFVTAERQGRKWFAYESSVAKYQEALEIVGKPVLASEQDKILKRDLESKPIETKGVFHFSIGSISKKFHIAFLEIADTIALALERLFLRYRSVVLYHSQARIALPAVAYSGLNIGLPPANLPVGKMHESLANKPFYRESYLTVPIAAFAFFMLFNLNPGLSEQTIAFTDRALADMGNKMAVSMGNVNASISLNLKTEAINNKLAEVAGVTTLQHEHIEDLKPLEKNSVLLEIHESYDLALQAIKIIGKRGSDYLKSFGEKLFLQFYTFAVDERHFFCYNGNRLRKCSL